MSTTKSHANKARALAALALLAGLGISNGALAKKKHVAFGTGPCEFKIAKVRESLSQFIRSNPGAYWCWAKYEMPLLPEASAFSPFLESEGVVAGDPHLGNFNVIPVTVNGKRVFKFVNIDFDDAGIAPFALDFVRLGIALNAEKKLDLTTGELVDAYLDGLMGEKRNPPPRALDALQTAMEAHEEKTEKWVEKKTDGDTFDTANEKNDLIPYKDKDPENPYTWAEIESVFPKAQVLAVAERLDDRGGSTKPRLWVLIRDQEQRKRIFELKPYEETSTANYRSQSIPAERIASTRAIFWNGIDPDSYKLVEPRKGEPAWLREKKRPLYDYDRGSSDPKEQRFIKELSLYIANNLGQAHGAQETSKAYTAMINKNRKIFEKTVEKVVEQFIQLAKSVNTKK